MYLWVGSGVESGMEGLSRTAGSGERPGAFFCGPYLLLLCFLTLTGVGGGVVRHMLRATFITSLRLFTVIHAVLFMALYCTVKMEMASWRCFINL